jgi:hypothetical protein
VICVVSEFSGRRLRDGHGSAVGTNLGIASSELVMRGGKRLAILFALALLAGCQGRPTVEGPSTPDMSLGGPNRTEESTTTVLSSEQTVSYRLYEPGISPSADAGVSGHLGVGACRWRRPGLVTFDLRWTPSDESSWPVTIPISLTLGTDDVGQSYLVDVVLSEPGDFSIDFDFYKADARQEAPSAPRRWQASRGIGDGLQWCTVDWFSEGDFLFGSYVDMDIDIDLPPDPPATPGGLEEIIAQIDPTDQDEPLLPLVSLFSHHDLPAIDRLFIHPTASLQHVSVGEEGSCLSISSDYGELGLFVTQRVGCPRDDDAPEPESVLLPDDIWEVIVSSPDDEAAKLADQMESIPLLDVEPFTPSRAQVDPDSIIDAQMSERQLHLEIARLEWSGGKIAVVRGVSGTPCCETYMESIVVTPEDFTSDGLGTECRDYSQVILSDDERAFLLIVTQTPGYRIQAVTDGTPLDVPLQPAVGDREVGLLDLTGVAEPEATEATITDGSGDVVACIQD